MSARDLSSWTVGFVFLAVTSKSQFIAKAHRPTHSGERINTISELESSMNEVQVEQKTYQMPPQNGFTVAHFLTVADIERSARFYETVFGGRILSRGDSSGAPGYIQIANKPGAGDVLVRVAGIGINPEDMLAGNGDTKDRYRSAGCRFRSSDADVRAGLSLIESHF
jgi:hypothetical protein